MSMYILAIIGVAVGMGVFMVMAYANDKGDDINDNKN